MLLKSLECSQGEKRQCQIVREGGQAMKANIKSESKAARTERADVFVRGWK
jgi:hypothetical protein